VLTTNQQQTDLRQSYVERRPRALALSTRGRSELANELNSIEHATTSNVLVQTHDQWLSKSNGAATSDVSLATIKTVGDNGHATEQTVNVNGQVIFVVGVPIPAVETQFFEVFQLSQPRAHPAHPAGIVLGAGALATSIWSGISGGLWVARRAVRPLERGLDRSGPDRQRAS
jgi:two-component system sensor histidine kinase MtrB